MDKAKFKQVMEIIAGAYRDDRYAKDVTLNAWYRYFKNCDAKAFQSVVDKWIKKKAVSPQISDLLGDCRQATREMKQTVNDVVEESDKDWLARMEKEHGKVV